MLAFGKHDGGEVAASWRESETANPHRHARALRGIHGLLEHHGASPKPWMRANPSLPLVGREGGAADGVGVAQTSEMSATPTPSPSPQGGGE
jgi:hypothetical protein